MRKDDVIERLEKATGPCRELDKAILLALGYSWRGMAYWFRDDSHAWEGNTHFTVSIDAALTLRPDGALYAIETYDSNGIYPEHVRASAWVQGAARAFAATPALAICIAALKARHD